MAPVASRSVRSCGESRLTEVADPIWAQSHVVAWSCGLAEPAGDVGERVIGGRRRELGDLADR